MLAVVTLLVMACVAQSRDCIDDAAEGSSSASNIEGVGKGSSMVQVRQLSSRVATSCSIERAKEEPLTENGFAEISKSCCYEDVKAFTSRVIDDMGLKVCDEGGLSGMAPFYSCPASPATLAELKAEINRALPTGNTKCHWLQKRYEKCTYPALECAVSAVRPPPYPQPVASGFIAFKATNPAEMMRSSKAIDVMQNDIALTLGVDTSYVNVVIGSGPLDGEEVTSSLFQIPKGQAFYSLNSNTKACKVFAAFAVQDTKPMPKYTATPAPSLDEAGIVEGLKHLDTAKLGTRLTKDLAAVDSLIGSVDIVEEAVCEKTSGRCTHQVKIPSSDKDCASLMVMYAHLKETADCLPDGLQESHLQAVRRHAALLALGARPSSNASQPATSGATASLDAAGFKDTTSLCCPVETEQFFNRLLESKGFDVCSKPHVQGLMHWFSCVPDMDFQYVLDVINEGNPCKYWAPKGATCPALSAKCDVKWCR